MMQDIPAEIPVVIVGAGPTGLTTGLLLAAYGVKSVVLERNPAQMEIPRAIVLDDEGARTLQVFGGDKVFVDKTIIGDGAAYVDDGGTLFARVGAGAETYGFPKRHFINQPEMEQDLHGCIAQTDLCDLRFSHEVTGLEQDADGITVSLTDPDGTAREIRSQYVVAADGGRSPIRESLGIEMAGSTYSQDWIVIDTLNDPDQANYSTFHCSNTRPHVSVPAPHGGRRYEFMLLPGETHEEVLEDAFVADLVAPYRVLDVADIVRKTIYTFHARIADRWLEGRILLAGDAAHLTPPFSGQGMNAGLRDAANVAWKLAAVVAGGANDTILDSYDAERRVPAWAMIQLAVVMGDIVMPVDPTQVAFRQQLLEALKPFPAVQDYLLKMKFKPRPRFDCGLFLGLGQESYEASVVGEMIAQPDLIGPEGATRLDDEMGPGFALIAQDAAGAEALAALAETTLMGLPLAKLFVPLREVSDAMPVFETSDDRARPLRTHRDEILLIRPDRYCAAAIRPEDLSEGLSAYRALFA
jgi:3-(3-hydroxy-phenyl)propionate hydroxylase